MTDDVLCVVYSVFLSQGLMNSKMLSAALARASAKSARRSQLPALGLLEAARTVEFHTAGYASATASRCPCGAARRARSATVVLQGVPW